MFSCARSASEHICASCNSQMGMEARPNADGNVVTFDSCSSEVCCSASEHAEHLTLRFTELSGQTHLVSVGRQQPFSDTLLKFTVDKFRARCLSRNGRVKASPRFVTAAGVVVQCCTCAADYDLQDGDIVWITFIQGRVMEVDDTKMCCKFKVLDVAPEHAEHASRDVRRRAWDGEWYSLNNFRDYYGQEYGDRYWAESATHPLDDDGIIRASCMIARIFDHNGTLHEYKIDVPSTAGSVLAVRILLTSLERKPWWEHLSENHQRIVYVYGSVKLELDKYVVLTSPGPTIVVTNRPDLLSD